MEQRRKIGEANSFGGAADVYEKARPTYPSEAAGWLVPPGATEIVDLGAGTGKFTRSLVDLAANTGAHVTAIEPDPKMLAKLVAALPTVTGLAGTAEHLPLDDGSVDVVTVAQAWHWVDEALAVPEIARVLRPGGILGLVWNLRDERVDWVRELGIAMKHSEAERMLENEIVIGAPFGPTEHFSVEWSMPTSLDALLELVASRSYYIVAEPEERLRIDTAVRDLVTTHPELAGRETFDLPYRTHCFRAARP
jgi:SAM-dependent methyltransferase